jgi:anti-anti-sigma factor
MVHIVTDTTTKAEVVGLFVRGQLDLTAVNAFRESLTRATRTSRVVELHLGGVDFIDGCGLSMLMDVMARAQRAGRELRIVDASMCVRRLIEITDTADRLALSLPSLERRRANADEEMEGKALEAMLAPAFRI